SPNKSGVVCVHVPSKNWFSCDLHGTMKLGAISGVSPTVGKGASQKINPKFPAQFDRTLFNVVPFDTATADHIPGKTKPRGGVNLAPIFSSSGFDCGAKGSADIRAYGFVPLASGCGKPSWPLVPPIQAGVSPGQPRRHACWLSAPPGTGRRLAPGPLVEEVAASAALRVGDLCDHRDRARPREDQREDDVL